MSGPAVEADAGWRGALVRYRCVVIALIVAGAAVFAWRGPLAAVRPGGTSDFVMLYASARVWLHGGNPYDASAVGEEWGRVGDASMWHETFTSPVLLYPPSALAVVSPVAALPWREAVWAWAALNSVLAVVSVWAVMRLAALRGGAALVFLVAAAWLWGMGTGAWLGQTALVVMGAVSCGELLRANGKWLAGGVLLGVAAAVKPQLGLLFVVYEVGRMRWGTAGAAIGAAGGLLGVGAARLVAAGTAWTAAWAKEIREFPLTGNADPTTANPMRHQMLNLQYPLHSVIESRDVVRWAVYAIVGVACLAYFAMDRRRAAEKSEGRGEIVSLGMVAVVSLMVVYHRVYDSVVLLLPASAAARAVWEGDARARRWGWAVLVLMLPFVLPVSQALLRAKMGGKVPASIVESMPWNFLVMPHASWALLGMAVCLVGMRATINVARDQEH